MCGRFALAVEKHILEMLFQLEIRGTLAMRFNIAPSQEILAVRLNPANFEREAAFLRWGLVPRWAKDRAIGSRLINARAETAAEKPAFREAYRGRRILIPASGFYEWRREGKSKRPYYIRLREEKPLAMGGLWERHLSREGALDSCAILTTAANALIEPFHCRMPVIVPAEAYSLWLDPQTPSAVLRELASPYPAEEMIAYPVSTLVNNPANDSPSCIVPQDPGASPSLP